MSLSVFKNLNHFAGKSKFLDGFAVFCARYLVYLLVIVLLISAVFMHSRGLFVYPLLSGLCAAFVFNKIIYIFYKEPRPATLQGTKILIPVPENPSFPSRHAAVLFGISSFLFLYSFPLAIFFLVCSCFVGIARVFCGVHWFHDILAGAFIGFLSTAILYLIVNLIR